MFNIKALAVKETIEFQLRDAADAALSFEGKPCMAEIFGPGTKQYAGAVAKRQGKFVDRARRGKAKAVEADQILADQAEFLADITVRLDVAYEGFDGREKHLAIYSDRSIGFIAEQVTEKLGDWANFSSESAKS
jgi:hypothetical protein